MVLAPKPLLSGAVPLEAFLATLQKVNNLILLQISCDTNSAEVVLSGSYLKDVVCIHSTASQR